MKKLPDYYTDPQQQAKWERGTRYFVICLFALILLGIFLTIYVNY